MHKRWVQFPQTQPARLFLQRAGFALTSPPIERLTRKSPAALQQQARLDIKLAPQLAKGRVTLLTNRWLPTELRLVELSHRERLSSGAYAEVLRPSVRPFDSGRGWERLALQLGECRSLGKVLVWGNLNLGRASWHLSGSPNGLKKCHPPPARQAKPNKEALDEGSKLQGTERREEGEGKVGSWTWFRRGSLAVSHVPKTWRCGAKNKLKKYETGVPSTQSHESVRMLWWNRFWLFPIDKRGEPDAVTIVLLIRDRKDGGGVPNLEQGWDWWKGFRPLSVVTASPPPPFPVVILQLR